VHGDDAIEARALPAPDHELLVIEGLQIGLGQRRVDLYTLTLPARVDEPVAPSATAPFDPVLLVFEVLVSGESAVGGVTPEPSVLPVLLGGTTPAIGAVPVPVGVVSVGVVGLGVVGAPVTGAAVAVGLPGVVVVGVVVGVVVVVGLPAAGSLFRLSGSTTSEIGRGCGRLSVIRLVLVRVRVRVPVLELLGTAPAVIWGGGAGAVATGAGAGSESTEAAAAVAAAEPTTWASGDRRLLEAGAAFAT
jgi:hypothetical protein